MSERFDAVILGAGPAGEVALNTLVNAGLRLALVENELIGGECTNWGCIPSKTLLRPPDLKGESTRAAGVATPDLGWSELSDYRDYMVSNHDDSKRVAGYEQRGVTVLKQRGEITGPGRVDVGGRTLEADAIVVATGADAVIPPIPGLAEAGYWTNREVTALTELPRSVVFIGGGVVAVELGQFLLRFGVEVTIVQGPPHLADREEPQVGELLEQILREDGADLRLGRRAVGVRAENGERVVELDDGSAARGEHVVVATGRRPRTQGIGLETVGIEAGAARYRDRRALPGGRGRVGDRRRDRSRHVHPRRQVPGPDRGRRHPRQAGLRRLPRRAAGRLHRPRGGCRRHVRGGRPRGRYRRRRRHHRPADLDRPPLHVRAGAARKARRRGRPRSKACWSAPGSSGHSPASGSTRPCSRSAPRCRSRSSWTRSRSFRPSRRRSGTRCARFPTTRPSSASTTARTPASRSRPRPERRSALPPLGKGREAATRWC